jgi:FAD/FMN-containing dehydrogenase
VNELQPAVLNRLAETVGAPYVVTGPATLELYSRDFSIADDAPLADVVVRPADTAEVAAVVTIAGAHGCSIAVRGGGVSYTLGYVPSRSNTLLLDLSRMDAIHEVNTADLYATVGPGCTWKRADEATRPHGLRPVMKGPISGEFATVAGTASQSTGSAPMSTFLGLEVVLADARAVTTGSGAIVNAASPFYRNHGPDLTGLFLGDSGAFGIKTRCTFALERIPAGVAFASVAFDTLSDMVAAMTAIARSGIRCRQIGMDPLKNRTATRVGAAEGLRALGEVVRSARSVVAGMKQAAAIAVAGRAVLDDVRWSLHLTVEDHDQLAAERCLAALLPLVAAGRQIAPSVPIAMHGRPYSMRGVLGLDGQRWLPIHGVFALSRAAEVVREVEAFFAGHADLLAAHAIEHSFIVVASGSSWLIEPMFYWFDSITPLHAQVLGAKAARFADIPPNPAARAAVRDLRNELALLLQRLGAVHSQLGKFYDFGGGLQPQTYRLLTQIKDLLDARHTLNPGNLGWS